MYEKALQCGLISKEESESLRRSCSARTPVGIMETLHGKASALSAGGREHVQLEPRNKTQGKHAAFKHKRAFKSLVLSAQMTMI